MKKVLSACIDQVLLFEAKWELNDFIEQIKSKKQVYKIMWINKLDDGKIQIRIRRQYNGHFMEDGRKENFQ